MAEAMLIGAGIGAGGAMLTGNDPLKGAAIGGATGGIGSQLTSNPFTQEALKAGAGGATNSMMTTLATPTVTSGATAAVGNTMNPALTNGLGQSSNAFTQFGRDASKMATNAYDNVSDTLGQGFDYINDKTGLEKKDLTMMTVNQGANLLQPTPQQKIQPAPAGQGISRPNVDLSQSDGLLSSLPPMTPQDEQVYSSAATSAYPGQAPITDLSQLTPEQIMKLKQQGII
jgi:hypothetical protein